MPTIAPADPTPDVVVIPDIHQQVWIEPPYKVIIHNDHVTTFEFVEKLLRTLFQKSEFEAAQIATETDRRGKALVCVRPQSEAQSLVRKGIFAARMEGFPLMLSAEPDEG